MTEVVGYRTLSDRQAKYNVNYNNNHMARTRKGNQPSPDLLTQTGAAKVIGVTRQAIAGMVGRGELEGRTDVVQGLLLITKASAEAAAERRRQDSDTAA